MPRPKLDLKCDKKHARHGLPGTAVFLSAQPKGAPASLLHNIRHNQAQPRAAPAQYCAHDRHRPHTVRPKKARVAIKAFSHGFFRIIAHFGFMETPTIGEVIQSCALKDFVIEEHKTRFFLGRETIIPTGKPGMARWREHLFVAMSHHAQRPAEFFKLPVTRTMNWEGKSKFNTEPIQKGNKDKRFTPIDGVSF